MKKEKELDGTTLRPLLEDPNLIWPPTVTTQGKGNHSVISERWHYTSYARGFEELYDLENDPMQWTNLIHADLEIAKVAIAELKTYLPAFEAEEILKSQKDNSIIEMDNTIKIRRDLRSLK